MATPIEVLEREVRRSHRAFDADVEELHARAEPAADWQAHYRAHMGPALGAALIAGAVLGALTRGPRGLSLGNGPVAAIAARTADALVATAMGAAVAFVADLIPGFGEEYRGRGHRRLS